MPDDPPVRRIALFLLLGLCTGSVAVLAPFLIFALHMDTASVTWFPIMPGLIFGIVFGWVLWRMRLLPGDKVLPGWVGATALGYFCAFMTVALAGPLDVPASILSRFEILTLSAILGGLIGSAILTLPFRGFLRPHSIRYMLAVPVIASPLLLVSEVAAVPSPVVFCAVWQGLYGAALAWRLREPMPAAPQAAVPST